MSEDAKISLDELLMELYSRQLLHDAQLTALRAFVKSLARHIICDDSKATALIEEMEKCITMLVERSKTDNIIYNQILNNEIAEELKGITGIHFKKDS